MEMMEEDEDHFDEGPFERAMDDHEVNHFENNSNEIEMDDSNAKVHFPGEAEENPLREDYRTIRMREIMHYYRPKMMVVLGIGSSVIVSVTMPLFGYLVALYIFVLQDAQEDEDLFWSNKLALDLSFFFLCLSIGIFTFTQKIGYAIGGENLISSFRKQLFEEVIYKHCAWFDNKNRAVGVLTTIFAEDIQTLNGLTSETISALLEAILGTFLSCAICFYFSWELAIICAVISPILIMASYFMSSLSFGYATEENVHYTSNALLADMIINHKTVISFGQKNIDYLLEIYQNFLQEPYAKTVKSAHYTGLLFGFGQFIRFIYMAVIFYIATLFIDGSLVGDARVER
mmetsp:Transcript_7498/g.6807  ORF Transcript_7498/g.6807 Transcript_7498/m.6807 type:complete len:345 (-) Transcript_7498:1515-2549(-)